MSCVPGGRETGSRTSPELLPVLRQSLEGGPSSAARRLLCAELMWYVEHSSRSVAGPAQPLVVTQVCTADREEESLAHATCVHVKL